MRHTVPLGVVVVDAWDRGLGCGPSLDPAAPGLDEEPHKEPRAGNGQRSPAGGQRLGAAAAGPPDRR
jgi:hypothetical protein